MIALSYLIQDSSTFGGSFVASFLSSWCSSIISADRFLSRNRVQVDYLTHSNKRLLHFSHSVWAAGYRTAVPLEQLETVLTGTQQMADISFSLKGYTRRQSVLCYCQANVTFSHWQGLKWDLAGGAWGEEMLRSKTQNNSFFEFQYIFLPAVIGWSVLLLSHWIQQDISNVTSAPWPDTIKLV